MLNIAYAVFGAVFMVGMALFAFLKGGQAERLGAGAYLFAWLASVILQESSGFRGMPAGLFLIDLASLVIFIGLSWRYRQSWPVWASGIQLITVMCHLMIFTQQHVLLASLITVMNLNSYLIILCLIVGTFFTWQDRRMAGLDR